ncbi:MAG: hypothetical protein F6K50_32920 [Moorea sp. SIO3I7]|nr:hypothetical protein [Moorena sp. SIO3I7]NEQ87000.1 hypothetical protein [Moorena sp. SIO2I5]
MSNFWRRQEEEHGGLRRFLDLGIPAPFGLCPTLREQAGECQCGNFRRKYSAVSGQRSAVSLFYSKAVCTSSSLATGQ